MYSLFSPPLPPILKKREGKKERRGKGSKNRTFTPLRSGATRRRGEMLHTKGRDGRDGWIYEAEERESEAEGAADRVHPSVEGGGRGREGERVKRCGRKREKEEGRGMLG